MADTGDIETRVVTKAFWRILPLLLAAYLASYLNRVNIGFASGMMHDLGLTATTFGLGAGLFFIGYFVFEIPSNLAIVKIRRPPLACPYHVHLGPVLHGHGTGQRR